MTKPTSYGRNLLLAYALVWVLRVHHMSGLELLIAWSVIICIGFYRLGWVHLKPNLSINKIRNVMDSNFFSFWVRSNMELGSDWALNLPLHPNQSEVGLGLLW